MDLKAPVLMAYMRYGPQRVKEEGSGGVKENGVPRGHLQSEPPNTVVFGHGGGA